jgi:3',5'-cyclic AMP phosphodiesterase CpdA
VSGEIVFLHLSDLHLTADPATRLHGFDPEAQLRRVLARIERLPIAPAFCIISGDLVDDGEPAAYARLRELLAPLRARTPVLLGLGNHDARPAFRRTLLDHPTALTGDDDPCCYARRFGDLRVLMLDSRVPGAVWGALGADQLAWLDAQLREPAPGGDLLVVHHPAARPGVPWLDDDLLRDADALAEVIAGRRLLGLLAGHCHVASATPFAGTLAVTAPGVVFQFDPHPRRREEIALPGCGFALGAIRDGALIYNPIVLPDA